MTPQATVLTSGARITTVTTQPQQATTNRIVTTQPSVTIGRLSVAAAPAQVSSSNILGQTRTLNLHSLVVANPSQTRNVHSTQTTKVITQSTQGL